MGTLQQAKPDYNDFASLLDQTITATDNALTSSISSLDGKVSQQLALFKKEMNIRLAEAE